MYSILVLKQCYSQFWSAKYWYTINIYFMLCLRQYLLSWKKKMKTSAISTYNVIIHELRKTNVISALCKIKWNHIHEDQMRISLGYWNINTVREKKERKKKLWKSIRIKHTAVLLLQVTFMQLLYKTYVVLELMAWERASMHDGNTNAFLWQVISEERKPLICKSGQSKVVKWT